MQRVTQSRADEGAVGVLVAVILAFALLLGLGAIVLDFGALHAERRIVQNGADAAVLAIAQDCAQDSAACDVSSSAAQPWADDNAGDAQTSVAEVCRGNAGQTGSCTSLTLQNPDSVAECLPPDSSAQAMWSGWIEVRTEARTNGTLGLPNIVSGGTQQVGACARAAWGPPGQLDVAFPVTFSKCEYEYFIATGGLSSPPEYDAANPMPTTRETMISLKDPDAENAPSTCPSSPPGGDVPGGFGWIDVDSDCTATIDAGSQVGADTGNTPPSVPGDPTVCDNLIVNSLESVIWIPVYEQVSGTGDTALYTISGFAGFYLTGFNLGGGGLKNDGYVHGWSQCPGTGGSGRCLIGWFVTGTPPSTGTIGGGVDYGVRIVQLVG